MRRGFSLIEMLILLALTALLMSILLPSLALGRERSRGIKCQSNLRQLGMIRLSTAPDRWGNSPYDFSDGNGDTTDSEQERGSGGKDRDHEQEGDPTRAKDGDARGDSDFVHIWEMELRARSEPEHFPLACPSVEFEDENSYGIYHEVIYRTYEYVQSQLVRTPLVYGCSEFKVVDVVRSFDYRHSDRTSVLFNDMSVRLRRLEDFPDDMVRKVSER